MKSLSFLLAMTMSGGAFAFAPTFGILHKHQFTALRALQAPTSPSKSRSDDKTVPTFEKDHQAVSPEKHQRKKDPTNHDGHGKKGIFTPLVATLKKTMGEKELNKLRGKVIELHSNVITSFVSTSETPFGQETMEVLFHWADKDQDGAIEEGELAAALHSLGFSWLQEKQVDGILERADTDGDGVIEVDEFKADAPKTLKRNLPKLAKKNGGDLGFLS